jgi:hypothetical protein
MVPEDVVLDLAESIYGRAELQKDVDALAFLLDHLLDPAHLPLDPAEAGYLRLLHIVNIGCPPMVCQGHSGFVASG